ncbi:MAG: preprotein translocase subunit YajC [Clostridia bacterium]|nr:preprotein translocase subunit YajC [Clostridia bacterium]
MNFLNFLLESEAPSMGPMWIIMIVMLVAMWFFTSRSQKKRDQEAQNMRDSLQVGDEVTTIGGIIGKVVSIKEETFVLETTKEKTHIRFLKGAIRSIDVKIADLTAAENKDDAVSETEEKVEETPKKKLSFFRKK